MLFDLEKEMKTKNKETNGGRSISMRSILITILLNGIVLLGASSCATVPKEPLASGEVRLLSISVPGAGLEAYASFPVNIFFEAAGNPEIKRACFYEIRREQYCSDVSDGSYFTLGTKRAFQVYLPGIGPGSHRVECYAVYIRNGETRRTNVIFAQIVAGRSPR